jgi:hypothetical protein
VIENRVGQLVVRQYAEDVGIRYDVLLEWAHALVASGQPITEAKRQLQLLIWDTTQAINELNRLDARAARPGTLMEEGDDARPAEGPS